MSDCCNNYLGSFPHSKNIHTGLTGTQSGQYVFEIEFAGAKYNQTINVIGPAELILYKPFNENYTYKMKVKQPDGTYLAVLGCDNHTFKTFILVSDGCGSDCEFEYN